MSVYLLYFLLLFVKGEQSLSGGSGHEDGLTTNASPQDDHDSSRLRAECFNYKSMRTLEHYTHVGLRNILL